MVDEMAVVGTMRRQLGLITRQQALAAGLTEGRIRGRVRRREWWVIRPQVYASVAVAPTPAQAVLAVVLSAGPEAWASHRTAARLHGLDVPHPPSIDVVTTPGRSLRLDGVSHHRSRLLDPADLTCMGGVPATSVGRTIVDCARWLPGRRLAHAIDDACRRRLLTYDELDACHARLDRGRRTGRRLVVPVRPVVADRAGGRLPGGSNRELDVLEVLAAAGRELPVQQHLVVVAGRERKLDFAYPDDLVAIEWDGFAEHGLIRSTFDDDRHRDNELRLAGWIVIHITSNTDPADLVRWVDRARSEADHRRRLSG